MAPRSGQSEYVDHQDHLLFGIDDGFWGGDEVLVPQDRDLRASPELTNNFFSCLESHTIPLPIPVITNAQVSCSAPVFALTNSITWEDTNVVGPTRHTYTEGFNASNTHRTHHSVGWDNFQQIGYSGSWTENRPSSSFNGNSRETPFTGGLISMPAEEYSLTFLSPNHIPAGWMPLIASPMSRAESNASLETTLEEPSDPIIERSEPIDEDDVLLHPSLISLNPHQAQPPREHSSPSVVRMSMAEATSRLTPETGLDRKATKGRKGPLNLQAKKEAAEMRSKRACDSCRRRKIKCDKGAPCRACIQYYKGDLVHSPCRGLQLQHLAGVLLSGNVFPSARPLIDYTSKFRVDAEEFDIELRFGFGTPLVRKAKLVHLTNYSHHHSSPDLEHDHVVYPWPTRAGQTTQREVRRHHVFPAVLSKTTDLSSIVEDHITTLLDRDNFAHFPLFNSPLKVLRTIYMHYESLPESSEKQLLRQALKLLVLVHIGGDTTIYPTASSWGIITHFFGSTIQIDEVTPCFIRGQLGPIFSELALGLMKEVLNELEFHCLSRNCAHFPLIISTFAIVFMAVESIQYHAAKDSYHATYNGTGSRLIAISKPSFEPDSEGVDALLNFYKACFSGCHSDTLLSVSKSGAPLEGSAGGGFVTLLKDAVGQVKSYLIDRSAVTVSPGREDMTVFFDRLLARLFLLQS